MEWSIFFIFSAPEISLPFFSDPSEISVYFIGPFRKVRFSIFQIFHTYIVNEIRFVIFIFWTHQNFDFFVFEFFVPTKISIYGFRFWPTKILILKFSEPLKIRFFNFDFFVPIKILIFNIFAHLIISVFWFFLRQET